MLSEERIRELLDAHLPKPGPGWNNETLMSFPMAFGLAVAEAATAAEHERLMEVVCEACGSKPLPRYGKDSDEPYDYWCDDCVFGCEGVTRAEYLRLHPEAGEGGEG